VVDKGVTFIDTADSYGNRESRIDPLTPLRVLTEGRPCLEGGWGTGKGGGTTPRTGNYLTTRHPDGALSDPAVVASCIPGATLTKAGANGVYQGTMRVKFGPTVAQFRGEARLTYDHAARRCSIEGRGIDGRGASRANASGAVEASGTDTTVLKVEGNFNGRRAA
jgi:hypothetical protein